MIFDTHTHSYFDSLADDEAEILRKMTERGVTMATQIGCDVPSSRKAIGLAKRHPTR